MIKRTGKGLYYFNPLLIITPFDAFIYHLFENIMENGAFAPNGHMLYFP